jgi:hypothetical protein
MNTNNTPQERVLSKLGLSDGSAETVPMPEAFDVDAAETMSATGLLAHINEWSDYPPDCRLTDCDIREIVEQCNAALCTTNGDTGPVTMTARQALLLLRVAAPATLTT